MVGFTTLDVLRLEVEADPSGLSNLIQNPSGELGGWGWVTPVSGSAMVGGSTLVYTSPSPAAASWFYSEAAPITAGEWVAASWVADTLTGYYRVRFEWLDGAGAVLSSTTQTGYLSADPATRTTATYQAPASTQAVRIRFDHYSTTAGANPTAGAQIKLSQVTMAKAATSAALATVRTNLITNPSFETNAAGWVLAGSGSGTISRSTAQAAVGTASLLVDDIGGAAAGIIEPTTSSAMPVTPGQVYTAQARLREVTSFGFFAYLRIDWYTSGGALISSPAAASASVSPGGWTTITHAAAAPATAATAKVAVHTTHVDYYLDAVMFEQSSTVGAYFDGTTAAGGGWVYSWTGTAHASTSTATLSSLAYIPATEWLDVLGPTHEIRVNREELNLGTVEGTIYDATLDPAQADTLRPGRRLRLTALAGAAWSPIITATLRRAQVTYDPLDTSNKRARIEFLAVDNTAALANTRRAEGVETIGELPYVLEGCGVPWNVNGSGDQVPTAAVVALNDNASAADQVAITRDSNLGRAWVDRRNIVQVWDDSLISATVQAVLDETTYSDVSIDYDSERCINYVTVKVLTLDAAGETQEVAYGPYTDTDSIGVWGVRAAEFTVQRADADETTMAAFAASILAANATPVVRINSLALPIRTTADLSDVDGQRRALLDLYDRVTASNANTGVTSDLRITKLSHTITGKSWTVALDFTTEGGVAQPQVTPSPPTTTGQTLAQLLRPVGEVTMWYGASGAVPAGWLLCNGAAFSGTDYPALATLLGGTTTPNMVDVFPIGAGTKAKGTNGGAPTKTIADVNLPSHSHPFSRSTALGSTGTIPRGGAADGTTPTSGASGIAATPMDIMPPWRALHFIIRAR